MKYYIFLTLLFISATSANEIKKDTLNVSPFGKIQYLLPTSGIKNVILFLVDKKLSKIEIQKTIDELPNESSLILKIPLEQYLKHINKSKKKCFYPAADFEELGQFVQKKLKLKEFHPPLFIAHYFAAELANSTLRFSPQNTFQGVISIDSSFIPFSKKPYCSFAKSSQNPISFSLSGSPTESVKSAFEKLIPEEKSSTIPEIKELPVIEIFPQKTQNNTLVFIMSGDGGWTSIDKELAEELNKKNIPVIGFNSLKYFWNKRTEEETSSDIKNILTYYLKTLGLKKIIMVGYSYGASFIPFIVSRFDKKLSDATKLLLLLSPSEKVDFEFHPVQWLSDSEEGHLVLPEIKKNSSYKTLCFFGEDENDTLCTIPDLKKIPYLEIIKLSGGHHYNNDYSQITETILKEIN